MRVGKVSTDFLREQSTRLGQNLLYPPNVKGWPGDQTWINSNTVLLRFNFAMAVTSQRQQEYVRKSELEKWLKQTGIKGAADVVDYFALMLLDGAIEPDERDKLVDFMNRGPKGESKAFALTSESINTKIRGLLHVMMAMPEYQLA